MTYVWVAVGGALGSVARYASTVFIARTTASTLPWGTLAVNASGSLVIGLLAALLAANGKPLVAGDARAFLLIGVLGGFTTFSSFSLETLALARAGAWAAAGANVMGSVVLCLVAVWLGFLVGDSLNR